MNANNQANTCCSMGEKLILLLRDSTFHARICCKSLPSFCCNSTNDVSNHLPIRYHLLATCPVYLATMKKLKEETRKGEKHAIMQLMLMICIHILLLVYAKLLFVTRCLKKKLQPNLWKVALCDSKMNDTDVTIDGTDATIYDIDVMVGNSYVTVSVEL